MANTAAKLIVFLGITFYLVTLCISYFKSSGSISAINQTNLEDSSFLSLSSKLRGGADVSSFQDLQDEAMNAPKSLKFVNPDLAYKILTKLDIFRPVPEAFFSGRTGGNSFYNFTFLAIKKDMNYCEKHRAHIVQYPESVFEEMNFMAEWGPKSLVRTKALQPIGNDIMPRVHAVMTKVQKETQTFELKPSLNSYVATGSMYYYHEIGKSFSCITQANNQILGSNILSRKDYVAEAMRNYVNRFADRPECLNYDKFFPKTWLLYEKQDCEDFFRNFNSEEYITLKNERRIVYIRKVGLGSHRGEGVQPVTEEEEAELRRDYGNGTMCGQVGKNYIIQNYVHNPLLLNGNKFDFRMYLLVASTNPMIAYYHDGFLRVALAKYDIQSNDKKTFLTNLALNQQIYDNVKGGRLFEGMDEEQLKLAQQWSFERLQEYLLENGHISDPNWLDNYLRPEFQKALVHLLRLSGNSFYEHSALYELYGVDFMLDENLNLWFIEANSGPALDGYSKPMEKFIVKMLKDNFEIAHALLKSRMKRIVVYVNSLIENGTAKVNEKGELEIQDFIHKQITFEGLTKNYFEEEFMPSATNGFVKIIDANQRGVDMYQGLIRQECL